MVPSPPTFSPSLFSFNNVEELQQTISSSDGILQTKDLEEAEIYVEGVKLNYDEPAVEVLGHYLAYVTVPQGKVTLMSYESDEGSEPKAITADFHITNIVFNGVAYSPENLRF